MRMGEATSEPSDLRVATRERGKIAVVAVDGKVTRENQGRLRLELESLVRKGIFRIALDLEKVHYMDSAGLGCCCAMQKLVREQDSGAIAVFGATPNLETTWNLIRLDLVIPLFPDEERAVAWLGRPR